MKTQSSINWGIASAIITVAILIGGVFSAIMLRGGLPKTLLVEKVSGEPVYLRFANDYYSLMELNPLVEGVFTEQIDEPVGVMRNLYVSIESGAIVVRSFFNLTGVEEFFRLWFFTRIDLDRYPSLCIFLRVNRTIAIHIRVTGLSSFNGSSSIHHIWLDPVLGGIYRGTGAGEMRCANVADLFYSLVGYRNFVVTKVVVKVIDRYVDEGPFELKLIELMFTSSYTYIDHREPSKVILIKLNPEVNHDGWDLTSIRIYYKVKGLSKGEYSVYGVYWRNRVPIVGKSYTHILDVKEKYVATTIYYNSFKPYGYLQELSNITLSNLGNLCIILVSSSSIEELDVDYILLFFEKSPYTYPLSYRIDASIARTMLIVFVILIFVLPILVLVSIGSIFSKHSSVSTRSTLLLVALAFAIRLPLMLFTGHSFDMEIWKIHARTYYEDGRTFFEAWPTTPIYYYILILFYSYYALIRTLGLQDYKFLAHTFHVVEGFFIKLPFVIADIASFYAILRILNARCNGGSNNLTVDSKSLLYASIFLFNPLSILVSSAWGMYDPLALCFSLWSLYFFFVRKNVLFASLLGIIAGLTKPFGFLVTVPIIIASIRNKRFRDVFIFIALFLPLVTLAYLPMLQEDVYRAYRFHFIERVFFVYSGVVSWRGLGLYNFSMMTYPLIYLVSIVFIAMMYTYKGFGGVDDFAEFASIVLIIHYLMFRVVYVQHTLWILPFIITLSFLKGEDVKVKSLLIGVAAIIYAWSAMTPGYLVTGVPSLRSKYLILGGAAWGYLGLLAFNVLSLVLPRGAVLKRSKHVFDVLMVLLYVTTYAVGSFA